MHTFEALIRVEHGVIATQLRASSYADAFLLFKRMYGSDSIVSGPYQVE